MAGQDLEQLEFLYFVYGNENGFTNFWKQFCSLLKTHTYAYLLDTASSLNSQVSTWKEMKLTFIQ